MCERNKAGKNEEINRVAVYQMTGTKCPLQLMEFINVVKWMKQRYTVQLLCVVVVVVVVVANHWQSLQSIWSLVSFILTLSKSHIARAAAAAAAADDDDDDNKRVSPPHSRNVCLRRIAVLASCLIYTWKLPAHPFNK